MKFFYEPNDPWTREEIAASIGGFAQKASEFFLEMTPEVFFSNPEGAWSPAQNVAHLIKTTWPIALGLKLPSVAPRVLFGRPSHEIRRFGKIREQYYQTLANGFQAGIYAAAPLKLPAEAREKQTRMVRKMTKELEGLVAVFSKMTEEQLDSIQLPHPSLGRITVREMLFSSLNHDIHHLSILAERFRRGLSSQTPS